MDIPHAVSEHVNEYSSKVEKHSRKLAEMYRRCYVNTIETALRPMDDGTVFVLTGDIPAMWLRDSTAEVSHYIPVAKYDEETRGIIKSVIDRQRKYILTDPYANAFKIEADPTKGHIKDKPTNLPIVWERKYEIDSLCYPIRLTYLYWKATNDNSIINDEFIETAETTVGLWIREQNHAGNSDYWFVRTACPESDTLPNEGKGNPVRYTGMTWSGFRPSDDACRYGYLVASNMFAVSELGHLIEMLSAVNHSPAFIGKCRTLKEQIEKGIKEYAVVKDRSGNDIYACEVDGMGNYFCFDDANVPSLLSAPYLGYCDCRDPLYLNTRKFILSPENPYYYEGKYAKGVGSPHTPKGYIWHIALSMQGLTSTDGDEILRILRYLEDTDSGTFLMHEGFDPDNPAVFTRSWFSWSCSLFSELVEKAADLCLF